MSLLSFLHPLWKRGLTEYTDDVNSAVINSINKSLSDSESELVNSKIESYLLKADGEWLDYWGYWFGERRKSSWSDDVYRLRIINHVKHARNTVDGLRDAIADFINTNRDNIFIYEPYRDMFIWNSSEYNTKKYFSSTYYRYAVIDIKVSASFPKEIVSIINLFRPAGVLWVLTETINSRNTDAPIIKVDIPGELVTTRIENDFIMGLRSKTRLVINPSQDEYQMVDSPFYYNDKDSLFNSSKSLIMGIKEVNKRYSFIGNSLYNFTPLVTDSFNNSSYNVEQLNSNDILSISSKDGRGKQFTFSPVKNNLINNASKYLNPTKITDYNTNYSMSTNYLSGGNTYNFAVNFNSKSALANTTSDLIIDSIHKNLLSRSSPEMSTVSLSGWGSSPAANATGVYGAGTYQVSAYVDNTIDATSNLPLNLYTGVNGHIGNYKGISINPGSNGTISYTITLLEGQSIRSAWVGFASTSNEVHSYSYKQIMITKYTGDDIIYSPAPEDNPSEKSDTQIKQNLSTVVKEGSQWMTSQFSIPDNFEIDTGAYIRFSGSDSNFEIDVSKPIIKNAINTNPISWAQSSDETDTSNYILTDVLDVRSFINDKYQTLSTDINNKDLNDLFDTKKLHFVIKNSGTPINSEFNIRIYNFYTNLWVNYGSYSLSNEYKDIFLDIPDMIPLLNNNGVMYINLDFSNNKNSDYEINVDYSGFSLSKSEYQYGIRMWADQSKYTFEVKTDFGPFVVSKSQISKAYINKSSYKIGDSIYGKIGHYPLS
ncbi:hypothetical protein LpeD_28 [Lactobacillus phage LpeD]|uniref:Baseplate protein n=1 Tax=Lactobacillus phage LpeD TaxID=2041210 RepID=A0A291I9G6_9CAUD|nr:hypothetical protein HWB32_gp027 [Lactobacillus phage LpeD]ATG86337.1 hypothetical protein LpeD_28 [Lactobacillus phage LpeD]